MSDANHRRSDVTTMRRATPVVRKRGKAFKRGVPAFYLYGWLTYDTVLPNRGDAKGRRRFKKLRARMERRRAERKASE